MSIYAALQVAVSGLSAQSASIGNISDNLANAQTTGYKGVQTRFEALVTQSNANVNDPGGVRATPYYSNSEQGNLVQVASDTSLAISGSGYFPVRAAVVGADGTTSFGNTTYFTRAGDFTLNKNGYLVNGSGYYLTGYTVDENGVVDTSSSDPIQLSELLDNPVATSNIDYAANLPSSADVGFTSSPSTIEIYDSLGGAHDLTFTWTKTGTNQWMLNIVVPDAVSNGGSPPTYSDYNVTVPFTFNDTTNAGTIRSIGSAAQSASATIINGITFTAVGTGVGYNDVTIEIEDDPVNAGRYMATITDPSSGTTEVYDDLPAATFWADLNTAVAAGPSALVTSAVSGGTANVAELVGNTYTLSGGQDAGVYSIVSTTTNTAGISIALDFDGAGSQSMTIDFGRYNSSSNGVTQFSDSSITLSTFEQNGIPRGSFQSLSIDENGFVTLNYDNGRSRTIAQIPVVQFFAEDKLQRITGGVFAQTLASGSARYSLSGTNGAGTIVSNALESSNVDIADEFTKLIQAQQIYSANAKTITTANNMMQEAINIIR